MALKLPVLGSVGVVAFVLGCHGEISDRPAPSITQPITDLPCDVETALAGKCWSCHGQMPTLGLPSFTTVAALMAPSRTDPTQSVAAIAVTRMQSTTTPMPPPPATAATASEIALISAWVSAGYPGGSGCGPICTSGKTWTGGNEGAREMNPGMACIHCHSSSDEGPGFSVAGTIYPTVREPDLCYGVGSSSGAQIVITGADGRTMTLAPNGSGNFYSEAPVALPYNAKVVTSAGERAMVASQTSGDCNSCHTQVGANGAPGRIMLP